jgi:molecular chaperone GrpE
MRQDKERQEDGAEGPDRQRRPRAAAGVGTDGGDDRDQERDRDRDQERDQDLDEKTRAERELVEEEVDELRDELSQLNDRHLRLAAEFDNYRKRTDRDREAMGARLQVALLSPLLDVVDDMERVATSGEGSSAAALLDGIRLVQKKFENVLGAVGLEPIEAEGAVFDPSEMEAMMTVPTDDPTLDDHVADVFQRGYRLGEVLVRPARVRVLKYDGPAGGS